MTRNPIRTLLAVSLAVMLVGAALTGGAAAQTVTEPNHESDLVGESFIDEPRLGIAAWNNTEMDSVKMAYDDSGTAQTLPIEFNDSVDAADNQIAYSLDNVEVDDYGIFPRKDVEEANEASALDASEWTTDASGTAGSGSVSDVTPAAGVDAVEIATSSQTSGDTFVASYSNFSIENDAEKRVAMIGLNVDTIETGVQATIAFEDSDGDTKEFSLNTSLDAGGDDVIANQTGDGYFTQEKLANLATQGSGDGTFGGIEKINVTISNANADFDVYMMDVERKAEITLGEEKVDTDDDDELETETISEVVTPGEIAIHSIDTLPSIFDDATIHDLGLIDIRWTESQLPAEDTQLTISDAEAYGGYASQGEYFARLSLYSWIDLTHHSPVLKTEQPLVTDRYKAFGLIEDAGDQDFDEYDSFTDVIGSLSGEGELATLDDSIQPGQDYVVNKLVVYQDAEVPELDGSTQDTVESTGGFWNSGNPITGFFNWAMAGLASVVAIVMGALKLRG